MLAPGNPFFFALRFCDLSGGGRRGRALFIFGIDWVNICGLNWYWIGTLATWIWHESFALWTNRVPARSVKSQSVEAPDFEEASFDQSINSASNLVFREECEGLSQPGDGVESPRPSRVLIASLVLI